MADLSKCRPGNWLRYISENQYCTFISKGEHVTVEMYNEQRNLSEDDITFIKLTAHFLSVCKFIPSGSEWTKQVADKTLLISFSDGRPYLTFNGGFPALIGHLHTLQNAHYDITGEPLMPNIYGVHASD